MLMPVHRFMGSLLFILVVASIVTGITEKLFFSGNYSELPTRAVVGNLLGLSVVLYAVGIGILIVEPSFKKVTVTEDYRNLNE